MEEELRTLLTCTVSKDAHTQVRLRESKEHFLQIDSIYKKSSKCTNFWSRICFTASHAPVIRCGSGGEEIDFRLTSPSRGAEQPAATGKRPRARAQVISGRVLPQLVHTSKKERRTTALVVVRVRAHRLNFCGSAVCCVSACGVATVAVT